MQRNYTFILIVISVLLISSCRSFRHIYSPAPANNPAFREKGESELSILYSGGDGNNGIGERQKNEGTDILVAYAITDHWAVTGSYYFRREKDVYKNNYSNEVFDSSVVEYKRKLTDFGIGYFTPFNDKKKSTFSIYAGLGFGNFRLNDHGLDDTLADYSRFYEASLRKWYVQPGVNFWLNNDFSLGITIRYSFIHYFNNATSYNQREQEYFFLHKIKGKTIATFEPTISLQFDIPPVPWMKLYASTTATLGGHVHYPSTRAINGSIGLLFDLSKL
jgi:Outer membrane protein beta-barrel domain